MRLALITRRYPPLIGGAERMLGYLAQALAEAGDDVLVEVVTCSMPGVPGAEPGVRVGRETNRLTLTRLPSSRKRFLGTALYMAHLRRWLASHPIDLAYVSMLKHDAYVAVGEGRRRGFPVVLRPEGAAATGDLAWQSWGRFGSIIGRRCKTADAFVAISSAVRGELRDAGYPPERIHDLPNGVPVPERSWTPRSGWRDAPRAVALGRLAREKGFDTLIDAWPIVLAREPHATLTIIGDGPERLELTQRVKRLGLERAVRLAGPLDNPEILLRDSDLFVHPSREEGMSIAVLEAMALGLPMVASDIPGNAALIDDGEHGRLAPPDLPAALADSVLGQWRHFEHACRMGEQARRRVSQHYSIQAVAQRHLALFQALIDGGDGDGSRRASSRGAD